MSVCARCSAGPCRYHADDGEAWPCAASDDGSRSSVSPLASPAARSALSPLSSFLSPVNMAARKHGASSWLCCSRVGAARGGPTGSSAPPALPWRGTWSTACFGQGMDGRLALCRAVVFLSMFGQSRAGLLKMFSFVRPLFS